MRRRPIVSTQLDDALDDLKRVLEGAVDAAVILDQQHRVLYRNPAYDAYTGTAAARGRRRWRQRARPATSCSTSRSASRELHHAARGGGGKAAAHARDPRQARRRRGSDADRHLDAARRAGWSLETYRDVTAESRVQRKYHALLARERGAKEDLERKVLERTEALRRAQDQLVLNEKMSSLGRLVAGIAHELNNPINFVYGNVDFLAQYFRHLISLIGIYERRELPDETRRQARTSYKQAIDFDFLMEDWERLLKSVRAGAERTAQIVAGLKTFSRPQVGKIEETDLIAGLETTLHLLAAAAARSRARCTGDFAPLPRVRCRGGQVQQVFMNLLTNAAQAAGPGGEIFLDGACPRAKACASACATRGPGVPAELATKIFDPVLHDQGRRRGHRARPGDLAAHRALARRAHRAGAVGAGARAPSSSCGSRSTRRPSRASAAAKEPKRSAGRRELRGRVLDSASAACFGRGLPAVRGASDPDDRSFGGAARQARPRFTRERRRGGLWEAAADEAARPPGRREPAHDGVA